jgi:hypothetical protein
MFRENHVEGRKSPRRLLVNPPVTVSVGESRGDLLFDISEGGICLYGLVPKRQDELFPVIFDLPGDVGSVKGIAEIAWTSATKNRTGIRFLNFAGASQGRLTSWMRAPWYGSRQIAVAHETAEWSSSPMNSRAIPMFHDPALRFSPLPIAQQSIPEFESPELLEYGVEQSRVRPSLVTGMLVATAILCLAIGLLRSHLSERAETRTARETTSTTVPESPARSSIAPVSTFPATIPSLPASSSLDVLGFVLQVGAMRREDNADGLSNSLRRQNLPAFVFKRGTDRFYTVAVGPYSDMSSAMLVKDELRRENVKAILKRWVPE